MPSVYRFWKGSFKGESLHDILIKFAVPRKLVRLIKTCLDGTRNKVRLVKYLIILFSHWERFETGRCLIATTMQFHANLCY